MSERLDEILDRMKPKGPKPDYRCSYCGGVNTHEPTLCPDKLVNLGSTTEKQRELCRKWWNHVLDCWRCGLDPRKSLYVTDTLKELHATVHK